MGERIPESIGSVLFGEGSITINLGKPPKKIHLPRHFILDRNGRPTTHYCPVNEGYVMVASVIGDPNKTISVTIGCMSADQPFNSRTRKKTVRSQCSYHV